MMTQATTKRYGIIRQPIYVAPVRPRKGICLVTRARIWVIAAVAVAAALALFIPPLPASTQDSPPTVESASLRLWPEYDDPGLLVISAGVFTDTLAYPLEIAFPVPENARAIQATVDDPTQGLMNREWALDEGRLTYSIPLPGYHYEFYVDRPPSGDERELTYTFETPYAMKDLEITVQEPARSSDFSVSPEPAGSSVGSDGFTYYTIRRENLQPGERVPITIRYTKNDNNLSTVGAINQSPVAEPAPVAPAASTETPAWLSLALVGLGTAMILGAIGYWLWQQRRKAVAEVPPRPVQPARPAATPSRPPTSQTAPYCTNCGRPLGPDDRFCAKCGTPRRSAS
jgi:hypothetical protein